MKQETLLDIEWKHLDVAGETCDRCTGTIVTIRQVIEELRQEGKLNRVSVRVRETPLPQARIAESNQVLINGTPLEEILSAGVAETSCPSCSSLTGHSSCSRAVEHEGTVFEEIPAPLIRSAIEKVLANGGKGKAG